jgi:hypothetical protein
MAFLGLSYPMFTSEGPHIVMSRTDAQNGLDFHFKYCYLQFNMTRKIEKFFEIWSLQIVRKGIWPCPPPCHDASQCLL